MFPLLLHSFLAVSLISSPALAISFPSEGCGKNLQSSLKPGGPSKSFTFDSNAAADKKTIIKRRVRIALPKNYDADKPAPLVLAFHGKHRNGTSFETMTQFSDPKLNPDAISVFPDGVDLMWTGDPWAPHTKKNNDVTFVGELLDNLEEGFCVDKSRIYAAGFANGGGLVHLLACDPNMSKRIAVFTSASGAIFTDKAMRQEKASRERLFNAKRCKPARSPIPFLQFHGDEDELVAYNGKSFEGETEPVPQWIQGWIKHNGCDVSKGNTTTLLMDGKVTQYSFGCDKDDKPLVSHYVLHGVGHTWPSLSLLEVEKIGEEKNPELFDSTPIIMNFFNMHELPEEYLAAKASSTSESESAQASPKVALPTKEKEKDEL